MPKSFFSEIKNPRPLLQTQGCKWEYQTDSGISGVLQKEIQMHYTNWQQEVNEKHCHPWFLSLSGSGTGKSRLLGEFLRLVKESVSGIDNLE
jgi:hypothetical protein